MTDTPSRSLSPHHRQVLEVGSAIAPEVIVDRGYWTAHTWQDLRGEPFTSRQKYPECFPALMLPQRGVDGAVAYTVLRYDITPVTKAGKSLKYLQPEGVGLRLDVPPRCLTGLRDPTVPLWWTEGSRKADALASVGLVAVNSPGVDGWRSPHSIPDLFGIPLKNREVVCAYDSDALSKPSVAQAVVALARWMEQRGATMRVLDWTRLTSLSGSTDSPKLGIDDFLAQGGRLEDLQAALVDFSAWQSTLAPGAQESIELLEEPPPVLNRPLALVDGHAYAATWVWVRITRSTAEDATTEVQRVLIVIRDDGQVFGPHARPLSESGLDIALHQPPRDAKLWSSRGVKAYVAGERPTPCEIFRRLVEVTDHFVSFDRSLAPQRTMAEFIACYELATWFADAFSVIGFLWPNGGYGSGKTKLGLLVCEVAYLGEAILSGSSYATLRDLADYGATLLFDDAEDLADPKKSDPDKRNLLLAGNRRGTVVTVKEPGPDRTWVTRYLNAYCPRLFTATRLPDPILASRSIVVPLVRTADPRKANSEVLDHDQWPHAHRTLLDDLWALALAHQSELSAHEAAVNRAAPLVGRNLEPWRPVLAVAHWLESCGAAGLYQRMVELATAYQTERVTLEFVDHLRIVVRALLKAAESAPFAPSDPSAPFLLSVAAITACANEIATEDDLTDEDAKFTNEKRVGRALTSLRLKAAPKASGQPRQRIVTRFELADIAQSYGVTGQKPRPAEETGHSGETGHLGESHSQGAAVSGHVPEQPLEINWGEPESQVDVRDDLVERWGPLEPLDLVDIKADPSDRDLRDEMLSRANAAGGWE